MTDRVAVESQPNEVCDQFPPANVHTRLRLKLYWTGHVKKEIWTEISYDM